MTKSLHAIYDGSDSLKLEEPLSLERGARVRITIDLPESFAPVENDGEGWRAAEEFIGFIADAPEGVPIARDHDKYLYRK